MRRLAYPRERPEDFRLNTDCQLAQGLVFAGLGRIASSTHYRDSSLYGNHGTLTNMDPATDWVWNQYLRRWGCQFHGDNSGDRIALSRQIYFATSTPFSFTWWADLSTQHNGDAFMTGGTNATITMLSGAVRAMNDAGSAGSSSATMVVNGLRHYAVTRDAANLFSFFANGILDSTVSRSGVFAFDFLGCRADGADAMYGSMFGPLIYNRALSSAEICQLADPSNVMLSGLILPPRRRLFAAAYVPLTTGAMDYWVIA